MAHQTQAGAKTSIKFVTWKDEELEYKTGKFGKILLFFLDGHIHGCAKLMRNEE